MTQEKILDKLAKIKAMSESAKAIGNEAEAQAFAAMLQQLLLKHKLDMTDVQYAAEMKEEPIIEQSAQRMYKAGKEVYADFPEVEVVQRRKLWAEALASFIAKAYASRILVTEGCSVITFVGHRSNVQIAEYLFLTLVRSAEKMSNNAAKAFRAKHRSEFGSGVTPQGYRESWLEGFSARIAQRLQEERDSFGKQESQCVALVRVDKEAKQVESYVNEKFTKLAKAVKQSRNFNHSGWQQGRKAADQVNLKANAMKEGEANKQLN
jgi:hypothetical protein